MSSPCRYAGVIIDNCTRSAMKSRGGKAQRSMRWKWPRVFGRKRMPRRINLHSSNVHYEQVKRSNSQKLSGFGTATPTLAELQAKLDSVRREVRNLMVMGMDPSQPPDQAALIKELEQSARAETRLRTMALEYAKDELRLHARPRRNNAVRATRPA